MPNENEIKSERILVKEVFSTMWFRIPEYQRPYIWSRDEVNELLEWPNLQIKYGHFLTHSVPMYLTNVGPVACPSF